MLNSSKISLLDAATWQTIRNRDLIGLYSLETEWARKLISKIMPETFDELVAVVAVARPMPLDMGLHVQLESNKHHPESIDYIFPELKPVLQTFYGIILFVEQVEEIGSLVAGFNEKETKKLIKVLTSQKKRAVEKIRKLFIHQAENRSFDREKSAALFDKLATHAPCCVNKARLISITKALYSCAFLKTHHAPAYMATVMTSDIRDPDRMRILTGECRGMKITMQPPDINASEIHFSLNGNTIIFGLSAVIQDKDDLLIRIIQQRTVYFRFQDLEDFNKRVRVSENDVCAFESLKACGAFVSICDIPKKNLEQQLKMEKDFFGYYISGHPQDLYDPMEK